MKNKATTVTVVVQNNIAQTIDASASEALIVEAITRIANGRGVSVGAMAQSILQDNSFVFLQKKFGPQGTRVIRTISKRLYSEVA